MKKNAVRNSTIVIAIFMYSREYYGKFILRGDKKL